MFRDNVLSIAPPDPSPKNDFRLAFNNVSGTAGAAFQQELNVDPHAPGNTLSMTMGPGLVEKSEITGMSLSPGIKMPEKGLFDYACDTMSEGVRGINEQLNKPALTVSAPQPPQPMAFHL